MTNFLTEVAIEFESALPPPIPESFCDQLADFYKANVMMHASVYAAQARHFIIFARALPEKQVVAMSYFYLQDFGRCELWAVGVQNEFRHKGLASALLCSAIDAASRLGAEEFLIRWADPAALHVAGLSKTVRQHLAEKWPKARISFDAGFTWVQPGKTSR